MKYYIIAGEASGDLHGSNLIKEMRKLDPTATIRCWGGEKMQDAGADLVRHYRDLAFMGFLEVIRNLPTILKNLSFCKKDIAAFNPDAVIFIDYPGFNLRMAKWAKLKGYKTIYYISPQVWAWKENRVKDIKLYIDKMMVILPFEHAFYKKWNYESIYVGHPLVQVIDEFKKDPSPLENISSRKKIIALLPGSRRQEILKKLPEMLKASNHFPDYHFIVAKAPSADDAMYDELLKGFPHVSTVKGQTYELLNSAYAALVTSGTATLETALFGVPQVICYKGNPVSYRIAKALIKIKYIGLVNLIMDKEVVKELIQDEMNENNIVIELGILLNNISKREKVLYNYEELHRILSKGGNASEKAAAIVFEYTQSGKNQLQNNNN